MHWLLRGCYEVTNRTSKAIDAIKIFAGACEIFVWREMPEKTIDNNLKQTAKKIMLVMRQFYS